MFIDVRQNTDEWLQLRMKRVTSSSFATIMANYGKSFGDPAKKEAERIALEIVTGEKDATERYKSGYMQMGHDFEDEACLLYEQERFKVTTNGGFFVNDEDERIGDSPDRNIGENGVLEVKSVIPSTQFKRLKKGGYDTAYKWQIQNHIWTGKKEWCDFASYCPSMPENKRLYVFRVERDEDMIDMMRIRKDEFFIEVDKNIKILQS